MIIIKSINSIWSFVFFNFVVRNFNLFTSQEPGHFETMLGWRDYLMERMKNTRHEPNFIKIKEFLDLIGNQPMAKMRWVKTTAQNRDFHNVNILPLLSLTERVFLLYLNLLLKFFAFFGFWVIRTARSDFFNFLWEIVYFFLATA